MGTKAVARMDPGRKVGMWSTIDSAVETGWGPTVRLLTVLLIRGATIIGLTVAVGNADILAMVSKLFDG